MPDPFIIMCAPNGARRQKSDHANIPISPDEIAQCAEEIIAAGASILHLHVRNDKGGHSLDSNRYRAAIAAIQDRVGNGIIIQATSEAVGQYTRHEQMAMVKDLRPEAVSLALRELIPGDDELVEMAAFIDWMTQEHIFPQYILYDDKDYQRFETYRKQGIFQDDQPFTLFVLGNYQGSSPTTETELLKQRTREAAVPWAVCGFGIHEVQAVEHAARHNGHIRVGFENNIWRKENHKLSNNAEAIQHCADRAKAAKRRVASADDVRQIFDKKRG